LPGESWSTVLSHCAPGKTTPAARQAQEMPDMRDLPFPSKSWFGGTDEVTIGINPIDTLEK
jgi:hypothetical protein